MSWPTIALGEAVTFKGGGTPSRDNASFWSGRIPWATVKDFGSGYSLRSTQESITEEGLRGSASNLIPAGTVVIPTRMALGKAAIAEADIAINQDLKAVFPTRDLDSRFLLWYFIANSSRIEAMGKGATVKGVTLEQLRSLDLPMPPLAEQRRIAAILDKADALRAKRREAVSRLDQLLQSTFIDLFGDPVRNDRAWREDVKLGEVADIVSGITKGRRTLESVRSVPYLAVANVQDRHLKLASIKSIEATEAEIRKYKLLIDDLVLTEGGDPDKLGRGALWDGSVPDCIHQNHVFRVRVISKSVDPVFLNWLVGSSRGKRYFLSVAKQTTGIASINMSQLKSFPLLIPPIDLQTRFSAMVAKFEEWRSQLTASAVAFDHLFESLQQRAFAGKL